MMLAGLPTVLVLATEAGITDWRAYAALPLGVLFFLGSGFLLLRSNLGTKRAYLVNASLFFGFMVVVSLFWAFGAPGTPPATGPTNLPGQVPDEYQPTWTPFAETSLIAQQLYPEVVPDGNFEPVPEDFRGELDSAFTAISDLFASSEGGKRIKETWKPLADEVVMARGGPENYAVVRVTFQETFELDSNGEIPTDDAGQPEFSKEQIGQIDPEGESFTAYAFFDPGNIYFPSLLVFGISLLGFALHGWLLHADEQMERRELAEAGAADDEEEEVPAAV